MAYNRIILKKSDVASRAPAPADLNLGELAINTTDGKLYTLKGDGSVVDLSSGSGGGSSTFVSLTDTPIDYTGQSGKILVVNNLESGLEFIDQPISTEFITLQDTPIDYLGSEGKHLVVNETADGVIFIDDEPVGLPKFMYSNIPSNPKNGQDWFHISSGYEYTWYDENGDFGSLDYKSTMLQHNPFIYYRLNETAGSVINDLMGNHNGTANNAFNYGVQGLLTNDNDTCIESTGTTSYIDTPIASDSVLEYSPASIVFLTTLTLYPTSDEVLFGVKAPYEIILYRRQATDRKLSIISTDQGNSVFFESVNDVTLNQINHIALTYNGNGYDDISNFNLYINGTSEPIDVMSTDPLSYPTLTNDNLRIGNDTGNTVKFTDEFILYNNIDLSQEEILESYVSSTQGNTGQWIQKEEGYTSQRNDMTSQIVYPEITVLDQEFTDNNSITWIATNIYPPIWARKDIDTGATNFLELDDTPTDYTNRSNYLTSVNSSADGLEFVLKHEFIDLTDTPNIYDTAGKMVVINGTADGVEFVDAPTSGVNTFTGLDDTPTDYASQAGNVLVVNGAADGVEFVTYNGGGATNFLELDDTPADYTGQAGNSMVVKLDETGVEFIKEPYDLTFFIANTLDPDTLVGSMIFARDITINANPTFVSYAMTAPSTIEVILDIIHFNNGSNPVVGEIHFVQGSNTATLIWSNTENFVAGDLLQVKTRADVDDISDISFTIVGITE